MVERRVTLFGLADLHLYYVETKVWVSLHDLREKIKKTEHVRVSHASLEKKKLIATFDSWVEGEHIAKTTQVNNTETPRSSRTDMWLSMKAVWMLLGRYAPGLLHEAAESGAVMSPPPLAAVVTPVRKRARAHSLVRSSPTPPTHASLSTSLTSLLQPALNAASSLMDVVNSSSSSSADAARSDAADASTSSSSSSRTSTPPPPPRRRRSKSLSDIHLPPPSANADDDDAMEQDDDDNSERADDAADDADELDWSSVTWRNTPSLVLVETQRIEQLLNACRTCDACGKVRKFVVDARQPFRPVVEMRCACPSPAAESLTTPPLPGRRASPLRRRLLTVCRLLAVPHHKVVHVLRGVGVEQAKPFSSPSDRQFEQHLNTVLERRWQRESERQKQFLLSYDKCSLSIDAQYSRPQRRNARMRYEAPFCTAPFINTDTNAVVIAPVVGSSGAEMSEQARDLTTERSKRLEHIAYDRGLDELVVDVVEKRPNGARRRKMAFVCDESTVLRKMINAKLEHKPVDVELKKDHWHRVNKFVGDCNKKLGETNEKFEIEARKVLLGSLKIELKKLVYTPTNDDERHQRINMWRTKSAKHLDRARDRALIDGDQHTKLSAVCEHYATAHLPEMIGDNNSTSSNESVHSTLIVFAPKRTYFGKSYGARVSTALLVWNAKNDRAGVGDFWNDVVADALSH